MLLPSIIQPNSRIGIVATARKTEPSKVNPASEWLKSEGYTVVLGKHLFNSDHQFAGPDEERLADLQYMLDEESIRAIFVARGGYGTVRLLDRLNFDGFRQNPKWIIGYSDVTALHMHVNNLTGIATAHASMPVNIKTNPGKTEQRNRKQLLNLLRGEVLRYSVDPHPLDRPGDMTGVLTGGNLSVLYSLNGSNSMPDTNGKILFLEDLDEYLYHIDRMMVNLDRSGHLKGLAGLIIGGMTDMNDNEIPYGKTAEEIIAERVEAYDFPVKFGFPAGHQDLNLPVKLGGTCSLRLQHNEFIFEQH